MTFLGLTLILAAVMVLRRVDAKCDEDNCYRALYWNPAGAEECSDHFVTTVVPPPTTTTLTITSAVEELTTITGDPVAIGTIIPSQNIPTYIVRACYGDVSYRFESACSCIDAGPTITLGAVPTITDTVVFPLITLGPGSVLPPVSPLPPVSSIVSPISPLPTQPLPSLPASGSLSSPTSDLVDTGPTCVPIPGPVIVTLQVDTIYMTLIMAGSTLCIGNKTAPPLAPSSGCNCAASTLLPSSAPFLPSSSFTGLRNATGTGFISSGSFSTVVRTSFFSAYSNRSSTTTVVVATPRLSTSSSKGPASVSASVALGTSRTSLVANTTRTFSTQSLIVGPSGTGLFPSPSSVAEASSSIAASSRTAGEGSSTAVIQSTSTALVESTSTALIGSSSIAIIDPSSTAITEPSSTAVIGSSTTAAESTVEPSSTEPSPSLSSLAEASTTAIIESSSTAAGAPSTALESPSQSSTVEPSSLEPSPSPTSIIEPSSTVAQSSTVEVSSAEPSSTGLSSADLSTIEPSPSSSLITETSSGAAESTREPSSTERSSTQPSSTEPALSPSSITEASSTETSPSPSSFIEASTTAAESSTAVEPSSTESSSIEPSPSPSSTVEASSTALESSTTVEPSSLATSATPPSSTPEPPSSTLVPSNTTESSQTTSSNSTSPTGFPVPFIPNGPDVLLQVASGSLVGQYVASDLPSVDRPTNLRSGVSPDIDAAAVWTLDEATGILFQQIDGAWWGTYFGFGQRSQWSPILLLPADDVVSMLVAPVALMAPLRCVVEYTASNIVSCGQQQWTTMSRSDRCGWAITTPLNPTYAAACPGSEELYLQAIAVNPADEGIN